MADLTCSECGVTISKHLFENGVCIGCRAKKGYAKADEDKKNVLALVCFHFVAKGAIWLTIAILIIIALIKYVF